MSGYELYVNMNNKYFINPLPIAQIIHILWYVPQEDVQSQFWLCDEILKEISYRDDSTKWYSQQQWLEKWLNVAMGMRIQTLTISSCSTVMYWVGYLDLSMTRLEWLWPVIILFLPDELNNFNSCFCWKIPIITEDWPAVIH